MLRHILIKNYALIESLEIGLDDGLNVITGETGAGKSIIIDAITLLLGQRGNKDNIRVGAEKMMVQGEFDIAGNAELIDLLTTMDIETENGELIMTRSIDRRGKNNCRVNGNLVTVAQMKTIGEGLIDIHSQHEHNSLFLIETHRDLLDAFGGEAASELRTQIAATADDLKSLREQIKTVDQDSRAIERQKEIIHFEYDEIQKAKLVSGEDEVLEQQKSVMVNAEKLVAEASKAYQILNGDDQGEALGILSEIALLSESVGRLLKIDSRFEEYEQNIEHAMKDLENISGELYRYMDHIQFDARALDDTEKRLSQISGLKRKYGSTVDEIIAYGDRCAARLAELSDLNDNIDTLKQQYMTLWSEYKDQAKALYELRMKTTAVLAEKLENELKDLAMEKAKVVIDIEHNDNRISATGQDHVEFLISLNPGVLPKPIRKVASGGEISRVMLALKSIFSQMNPIGTMIFDEIDTGISGRTAQTVAEKIEGLSRQHQIICITHLPQIAAMADKHFRVIKDVEKEQTEVSFNTLDETQRAEEIARMISGAEMTQMTFDHAKEMIEMTKQIKKTENIVL